VATRLKIPVFILGGGKDIQVDPEIDTRYLDRSLRARNPDVTLHIAPDADHVLKHETKSVASCARISSRSRTATTPTTARSTRTLSARSPPGSVPGPAEGAPDRSSG